mmetsp:Transcript_107268/g.308586  ORF Transcript_107268/g.308586 Transcript_107268/m.308586 type:complete len:368 (+) Transcript_107268:527-1630(+)
MGDEERVQEEECALEEPVHAGLQEEVDAVRIEEDGHGDPGAERAPHPPVVLRVQVEVGEEHRDGTRDQQQHRESQQKDAVQRVDPRPPNGVEDVVELDVDGAEGQEPGSEHLRRRALVPAAGRDLARQLVRLAGERVVDLRLLHGAVAADDAAQDRQGEGDASPHGEDEQNRGEGEGRCGAVENGHGVEEGPDEEGGADEHQRRHEDVPCPLLATELLVQLRAGVATDGRGDHVGDDAGGDDCAALVEGADAADEDDHDHHADELCAGADGRAEGEPVLRGPEDIRVQQLPTCFFLHGVQLLIGDLQVARQVRAHDADDDEQEQGQDEQHQDEGVDDREPMDVHVLVPMRHGRLELKLQRLGGRDVR